MWGQNSFFTCKWAQGLKMGLSPNYVTNHFLIIFKCILFIESIREYREHNREKDFMFEHVVHIIHVQHP